MKGSGGAGASASRTASRTAPRVEESFAFAGSKVEEAMELEARGASDAETEEFGEARFGPLSQNVLLHVTGEERNEVG